MNALIAIRNLTMVTTLIAALAMAGCRVGPNYKRPAVPTAPAYRGAEEPAKVGTAAENAPQPNAAKNSLGDEKWWSVFGDPQLQELIRKGLAQNYDVRVAAERIVQAQAQLGVTNADLYPSLNGTSSFSSQRYAKGEMSSNPVLANFGKFGLSASWTPDFWGKYRRASEAARAQLLGYEWARRAVLDTLVSNIATAYFQLRTLDMQLEINKKTLVSRQDSLQLTRTLESGGNDSMLDVREAEQLVFASQAQIADLERQIEQEEDTLSALLGDTPHPITRGQSIDQQPLLPSVPTGVPSELLERRPDIQQAETALIAANAEIGVARAAYFPQISLTGAAGTDSNALSRLFTGPSFAWNYGPSLSVPIFDAARIRNNVRVSESEQRQAVLTYQQTIVNAFRDISKALVAYRKYREYRENEEQIVTSAADALHLSKIRYEQGQSSYLDVLTNDRTYLSAQLDLATAKQNELLSLVQVYGALGGGWQQ
jgi:multidrug efflux system outer membrane protein